jgi:collagenase-like PrtC family protease
LKKNLLNLGFNFDPLLVRELTKIRIEQDVDKTLNSNTIIDSCYGSPRSIHFTVRAKSRVADITKEQAAKQTRDLANIGIDYTLTLNTSVVGTLENFSSWNWDDIGWFLLNGQVARVVITHPLVLAEFSKRFEYPIEISTVFAINSIVQLIELKNIAPNIDRICMNLSLNRDMVFLDEFTAAAREIGVEVELLANEFCLFDCIYRNSCYALSSVQDRKEILFDTYPWGWCTKKRDENPVEWIKSRFILPQWMKYYNDKIGINRFKITGRTHPTDYIVKTARSYISEDFQGNLLELWGPLENIDSAGNVGPKYYIDTSKLDVNFLSCFYNKSLEVDKSCHINCGSCKYCKGILDVVGYKPLR